MRAILFLALGVAVLAGLFVVLRPAGLPLPPLPKLVGPPPTASTPAAVATAGGEAKSFGAPASKAFDLVVADGHLVSGPATLSLTQGDLVILRVRADRDDELHIHGYDLELGLHANQTGSLAFEASRSGRFEIELHHAGAEIGALEIQPR